MKIHELKCWPSQFADLERGACTAEFRKDDRAFEDGDLLDISEYVPTPEEWAAQGLSPADYIWSSDDDLSWMPGELTGDGLWLQITHVKRGGTFGIPEGYCVLSVSRVRFVTG